MPRIVQAGMGVQISSAKLANKTSRLGALGLVSSVGLRHFLVERVRNNDREVIEIAQTFPFPRYVEELLSFGPRGARHARGVPVDVPGPPDKAAFPRRLSVICAFIEVRMAKQGHHGKIGANVMWKCALTALPSIYGAMLAGVDALFCGAGVPMELPGIVRRLRAGQDLAYEPLTGGDTGAHLEVAEDDPAPYLAQYRPPWLVPILSNFAFVKRILDVWGREQGGARPAAVVLENHAAGGHNAPPRDKVAFGEQDDLESYFDKVRALGVPILVAGAFRNGGDRRDLEYWLERGAYGIQVGSRFALCSDSGMRPDLRDAVIAKNAAGATEVVTHVGPRSPSGYPWKEVSMSGTLSDPAVAAGAARACRMGYLLQTHRVKRPDGSVREVYACPAMPPEQYSKLTGADSRKGYICLCQGLASTAGFDGGKYPPVITLGQSGKQVVSLLTSRQVLESIALPRWVAEREAALQDEVSLSA